MPTKIVLWQCDVCSTRHSSEEDAVRCESRGVAARVPVGCIVIDHAYDDVVALIQVLAERGEGAHYRHVVGGAYWTFRDNPATGKASAIGDSYPEQTSGPLVGDSAYFTKPRALDTSTARYRRMWDTLTAAGVTLTVWDGEKAVPAPIPTS